MPSIGENAPRGWGPSQACSAGLRPPKSRPLSPEPRGSASPTHAGAWAREAGAARVYWLTQEFNTTARRLYDRVGKVIEESKRERYARLLAEWRSVL